MTKNSDMNQKAVDEYLQKFEKQDEGIEERKSNYAKLVNNYYDLVTDFYEYGWGQSFHFCRFYKGEGFDQAIARHEHFLAHKMGLKPGMKVLDMGCGVGGPMREIVRFSGAHVTGINNNAYQIERLKLYNSKAGLASLTDGVKGDFMNLPFEPETFDAVYAIEATVHAPSLKGVMEQVFRVLKPGGVFASYEWLTTAEYNPENPEHRQIVHDIEEGDGISHMQSIDQTLTDLKEVGFEIVEYQDLAEFDPRYEEPWYKTLQGSFSISGFKMTKVGRYTTDTFVKALEALGLAPKGSHQVSQLLIKAADALVAGGEKKLFTPMFLYVVRKPMIAEEAPIQ